MQQRQLRVASFLVTAHLPGFSQNGRRRGGNKTVHLMNGITIEGEAADGSPQKNWNCQFAG
jgi:hypothetical protein